MSSKDEKVKKQLEADRVEQNLVREALEKQKKERLLAEQLEDEAKKAIPDEVETRYQVTSDEDWKKIKKDYQEQYPDEPCEDGTLSFPDEKAAQTFFEKQAASIPPRKFLATKVENGKLTDDHHFSCGDGTLYSGSFAQIHAQLTAAQKANPDNQNIKEGLATIGKFYNPGTSANPAQNYRAVLQGQKESKQPEVTAGKTSTTPEEQQPKTTAPNPFSTSPNPFGTTK